MGTVPPVDLHDVLSTDAGGAVVVAVHAQPGAGRTEVVGRHGDALKVRVAAPPEGGRANEALLAVLADRLGVPLRAVSLAAGASSRRKQVRVEGVALDVVAERLTDAVAGGGPRGRAGRGRR